MDYKEKATILRVCSSRKGERCSHCPAFGQGSRVCMRNAMKDGATAITDLLARAEAVEAESARLQEEVERWKSAHHQAAINFQQENRECNKAMHDLKAAESRAEKAERERDAAIKRLRKTCWCAGCKHFKGLDGCQLGSNEECSPENDRYEFVVKEE